LDLLNDKELFGSLTPDRNLTHGDINLDGANDSDDEVDVNFADSDDDDDTLRRVTKRCPIIPPCHLDALYSLIGMEGEKR
jgi:hypothetical protein